MKKNNKKTISVPKIENQPEDKSFPTNKFIPILKIFVSVVLSIQIWLYVFRDTEKLVFQSYNIDEGIHKRTLLLIISIFLIGYSFLSFFRINMSDKIKNAILLLYAFVIFFLIFEITFMYMPFSQGTGYAYCSKLWFNKYWERNEIGYRDKPYNAATDTLKDKIVMLGDSYVAGHGTNNVEDRMSNLLEKKLGNNYRVFNLGKNGSTTTDEFDRLKKFKYKYDKLILVHVPNDLEYLDKNEDAASTDATPVNNGVRAFFVRESFFVNFLSYTIIGDIASVFFGIFDGSNVNKKDEKPNYPFSDAVKLKKHISNLLMVDSVLKAHDIKLLIVSFPYPGQNDTTANRYYNGFINQLKINHFNYMDAKPICNKLPLHKQVVSPLDGHPSLQVQKLVVDSIYNRIVADSWIK